MNSNEKNTALYEKMAAEQDTFRDWLKCQSYIKNDITAVHWRSVTSGEMERCIIGSGYR